MQKDDQKTFKYPEFTSSDGTALYPAGEACFEYLRQLFKSEVKDEVISTAYLLNYKVLYPSNFDK
jgi:hypothetical protein